MIELAHRYPYYNEDAETNWRVSNPNKSISDDMKRVTGGTDMKVDKIDQFKVHDMVKTIEDGSMLFVDYASQLVCSAGVTLTPPQLTDKER